MGLHPGAPWGSGLFRARGVRQKLVKKPWDHGAHGGSMGNHGLNICIFVFGLLKARLGTPGASWECPWVAARRTFKISGEIRERPEGANLALLWRGVRALGGPFGACFRFGPAGRLWGSLMTR